MNPFKKKRQAIKIDKTYDGVKLETTYKIDSPAKIKETINNIKNNKEIYQDATKRGDGLFGLPNLEITEINENYNNIEVVARLHYTYTSVINPVSDVSPFEVAFKTTVLITALFIAVIGISMMFLNHVHEKNMIEQTCFMYLKEGVPTYIQVGNTKYLLDKDGTINEEDSLLMNPYHKQLLSMQECVEINNKE